MNMILWKSLHLCSECNLQLSTGRTRFGNYSRLRKDPQYNLAQIESKVIMSFLRPVFGTLVVGPEQKEQLFISLIEMNEDYKHFLRAVIRYISE